MLVMDNKPKTIDKNADAIDYKPHFNWRKYKQGFGVLCLDAAFFALVCYLGYLFLNHVVLSGGIDGRHLDGKEFEAIVGHVAWPFSFLAFAFLFRNPLLMLLHETQGLIWRSYYRLGEHQQEIISNPNPNDRNIGEEEMTDEKTEEALKTPVANNHANSAPNMLADGNAKKPDVNNKKAEARVNDGILIERKVLGLLRTAYGVTVLQSKGIERSRYYFDGVMEYRGTLYGIEVKHTADVARWRSVLRKVGDVYETFTVSTQARFAFLVCIVASTNEINNNRSAISRLANEQPFPVELKFYKYENENLVEV